jgi:hypothetical protein
MTSTTTNLPHAVSCLLRQTSVGCGLHDWHTEGGVIRVTTQELKAALLNAYDEGNLNWIAFVELD